MADEPKPTTVQVDNAENVNVPADIGTHPALIYLVSVVTAGVLLGFSAVTYIVLSGDAGDGIDAATKGSIIQTWNNMAVAAVAVWTTSSIVNRFRGGGS